MRWVRTVRIAFPERGVFLGSPWPWHRLVLALLEPDEGLRACLSWGFRLFGCRETLRVACWMPWRAYTYARAQNRRSSRTYEMTERIPVQIPGEPGGETGGVILKSYNFTSHCDGSVWTLYLFLGLFLHGVSQQVYDQRHDMIGRSSFERSQSGRIGRGKQPSMAQSPWIRRQVAGFAGGGTIRKKQALGGF